MMLEDPDLRRSLLRGMIIIPSDPNLCPLWITQGVARRHHCSCRYPRKDWITLNVQADVTCTFFQGSHKAARSPPLNPNGMEYYWVWVFKMYPRHDGNTPAKALLISLLPASPWNQEARGTPASAHVRAQAASGVLIPKSKDGSLTEARRHSWHRVKLWHEESTRFQSKDWICVLIRFLFTLKNLVKWINCSNSCLFPCKREGTGVLPSSSVELLFVKTVWTSLTSMHVKLLLLVFHFGGKAIVNQKNKTATRW